MPLSQEAKDALQAGNYAAFKEAIVKEGNQKA
jgi:hypothetical protein